VKITTNPSLLQVRIFLSNEGVVPLFVNHFLHLLVEQTNPQLSIGIGQSGVGALLKVFLHAVDERPK
jgi:hypothetical protein